MGERALRKREVGGSIPPISTFFPRAPSRLQAARVHNHSFNKHDNYFRARRPHRRIKSNSARTLRRAE